MPLSRIVSCESFEAVRKCETWSDRDDYDGLQAFMEGCRYQGCDPPALPPARISSDHREVTRWAKGATLAATAWFPLAAAWTAVASLWRFVVRLAI